jgi:hypothetical protein
VSERKLSVKRELLAELTTDDLVQIAGATPTQVIPTIPINDCIVIKPIPTLRGCTTAIECP